MSTTELMEVHNDDHVVDIINCVALYYEKGASGNAFRGKKNLELLFQGKWRPWKSYKKQSGESTWVYRYLDCLQSAFSLKVRLVLI